MAQRTWYDPPKTLDRKVYEINLTFLPQGTSNTAYTVAAGTLVGGKGVASVVRNATAGEWLITLQDTYARLLSKYGSIQMASATDLTLQFATIANVGTATAPTILVRALAGATPTDIAANANNSVSVTLTFSDATT
ncbi:MAG TPA: hypothetical protein VIV60_03335 [Polyangiaceae bacterium]